MVKGTYSIQFNRKMRPCKECGKMYIPTSPGQMYCKKCKLIVKARQAKAANMRYKKRGGTMKKLLFALVLMFVVSSVQAQEQKRWVDDEGCTHITGFPTIKERLETSQYQKELNEANSRYADEYKKGKWEVYTFNAILKNKKEIAIINARAMRDYLVATQDKYRSNVSSSSTIIKK